MPSSSPKLLEASSHSISLSIGEKERVKGINIIVKSFFPDRPENIWQNILLTNSLRYVCWPLLVFKAQRSYQLPERWEAGEAAKLYIFAFGFIPLGKHSILLESIDQKKLTIQSRESGSMVSVWHHLIQMQATEGGTIYTDEIQLYAGKLTGLVAWWAKWFYRHRQRRWRRLLRIV